MKGRLLLFALVSVLMALFFFLPLSFPLPHGDTSPTQRLSQEQLESARTYLVDHFDPEVGLVYESEDNGSSVLGWYPQLNGTCHCWNTFWVYSDNLLVYHALRDHDEDIAAAIKTTYDEYASRYGPSLCYEVLFGEDIPDEMNDTRSYLVDEVAGNKYVFIDKHDLSSLLGGGDVSKYADSCMYKALDHLWSGDRKGALEWFYKGHKMFNGAGVRDQSAIDPKAPRYDTYKLALILYTSKILEVEIENYETIEERLWDAQQRNGGITAWMDVRTGKPQSTANAESTALTLLVYEDQLVDSLIEKAHWAEMVAVLRSLLVVIAVCVFAVALVVLVLLLRRRYRGRITISTVLSIGRVEWLGRPLGVVFLSAINLFFALVFLAALLVPFQTGVTMGTSPEGGAEDVATAVVATSFMLGLGVVGFLVCAVMSAGLWFGVSAVRYFTLFIYGVVFLGASLWLVGRGPQNIPALIACSPLIAFMWTFTLLGTPLDLSVGNLETLSAPITLYRVALVALAALTMYILTRSSTKQHFDRSLFHGVR